MQEVISERNADFLTQYIWFTAKDTPYCVGQRAGWLLVRTEFELVAQSFQQIKQQQYTLPLLMVLSIPKPQIRELAHC